MLNTSEKVKKSISELKNQIIAEQQKINKICPPEQGKEKRLEERLEQIAQQRGRAMAYPYLSDGEGFGPFTKLIDGSVKYDLIGGIGVQLMGHSHPLLVEANLEAATVDCLYSGNLMPYDDIRLLMDTLLGQIKESRLEHFWFTGSGTYANDTALKLLWQKKDPAYKIIAFKKCFTGRSVATQDITDKAAYRQGMPKAVDVEHVPHFDPRNPEGSLQITLNALEEVWNKAPGQYAAITLELVQGEGGLTFGTKEYYEGIFEWAKAKGLYIWVDEVQTFARTRRLFAFQHFGLEKYVDIVTVGKALQCCGLFYTEELNPKPGLIAGTFHAAIPALKAGNKFVRHLTEEGFYGENGKIAQLEKSFLKRMAALANKQGKERIPLFHGIGTMQAFEVGDASADITKKFSMLLMKKGVITYMAGDNPTRVRMLLPIVLEEQHLDEIFKLIDETIEELFT